MNWTTNPTRSPETLERFAQFAEPATLEVVANGGSVDLQLQQPGADNGDGTFEPGDWATFETFGDGVYKIEVVNMPAIQVVAIGAATYRWTWI